MNGSPPFVCPEHGMILEEQDDALICPTGCRYPVSGGFPRFVASEKYAARFGLQWKAFAKAQLDSHTGVPISRDRLTRLMGGSLDWLSGKTVLEAGCGAGRFTELLLAAGAQVTAVDLSAAVEANFLNNAPNPRLRLAQADIRKLPFADASFDVVACIGVVQHTPNPAKTLAALARIVRPGGALAFDHYTHGYAVTLSRAVLRCALLVLPESWSLPSCKALHATLWPAHCLLWRLAGKNRIFRPLRKAFLRLSPLVDYHDSYLELGPELLSQWALLDTHDTLTDRYKHLLGSAELAAILQCLDMADHRIVLGGNGLEAFARKGA